MVVLPELNDDQRLYLKTIFDYFHNEGKWPTYLWVENAILQTHPGKGSEFDLVEMGKSLPDNFATGFSFNHQYGQEAVLIAPVLNYFPEAKEEMADFIKAVRFCVEMINTSLEEHPEITSEDLSSQLHMQPLAIRKIGLLLQYEPDIFNGSASNDDWWRLNLKRGKYGVRRFQGVETFEQYLEKRSPLTRYFSGNVVVQPAQSEPATDVLHVATNLLEMFQDLGYSFYEGPLSEIKEQMPSAKELARLIASFANADGGVIIVGLWENSTIVGVPEDTPVQKIVDEAFGFLTPQPLIKYRFVEVNGKRIFVITVQKNQGPILSGDNRYYIRKGNTNALMEEDLIAGLATAVPSIKPNILTSLGVKEPTPEAVEDPNKFTKLVHEKLEDTKNISKLYEILVEPIKRSRDETIRQLADCRWQKRLTFLVSLISLTTAILLIFIGVILIFTNHQQVGVVSTIAGFLPGCISALAFTFNKQANDNNDKFYLQMVTLEKYYAAVQCIPLISDEVMMNETLRDFIKNNYQGI
jgi:hypothetical protein